MFDENPSIVRETALYDWNHVLKVRYLWRFINCYHKASGDEKAVLKPQDVEYHKLSYLQMDESRVRRRHLRLTIAKRSMVVGSSLWRIIMSSSSGTLRKWTGSCSTSGSNVTEGGKPAVSFDRIPVGAVE